MRTTEFPTTSIAPPPVADLPPPVAAPPASRLAASRPRLTSLILLTGNDRFPKLRLCMAGRSQVAKAADCKSAIVGSNPTGASGSRSPD